MREIIARPLGLEIRVYNTCPVKSVVKPVIAPLAASYSDTQGVRITKSFPPG